MSRFASSHTVPRREGGKDYCNRLVLYLAVKLGLNAILFGVQDNRLSVVQSSELTIG